MRTKERSSPNKRKSSQIMQITTAVKAGEKSTFKA